MQIVDEMVLVVGLEQFQRPGVDLDDADLLRTGRHPCQIVQKKRPEILYALRPPDIELALYLAEILDPHRHGRKIEDIGIDRLSHTGESSQG